MRQLYDIYMLCSRKLIIIACKKIVEQKSTPSSKLVNLDRIGWERLDSRTKL